MDKKVSKNNNQDKVISEFKESLDDFKKGKYVEC